MGDETASMFLASTATAFECKDDNERVIGSDTSHVSRANSTGQL